MTWLLDGRPLKAILVTRLRYLGDVVMSTPVLQVLRLGDPGVRLGFLAETQHGQVLEGHPSLDHLHLWSTRRQGADASARSEAAIALESHSFFQVLKDLHSCHYDLAVDLFFNPRSAWLLRLAGIRKRIGGTLGSRRFLYTHTVVPGEQPALYQSLYEAAPGGLGEHLARLAPLVHQETGLGFLDWFGHYSGLKNVRPVLPTVYWQKKKGEVREEKDPIVLAPGATWSAKEWPIAHWKSLVKGLIARTTNPVLVIQPPGRVGFWDVVGQEIPADRGGILPVMGLSDILKLLSRSQLLASVDGGIMHSGVALGVPTVGLLGPTDPALWFPYEKSGPFVVMATNPSCAPCNLHECDQFICLPDLEPASVLGRCLDLLEISNGGV